MRGQNRIEKDLQIRELVVISGDREGGKGKIGVGG